MMSWNTLRIWLLRIRPIIFLTAQQPPSGSESPHYRDFKVTLWNTTCCRTLLREWSARRRDLYLTTHNTHKRQTSMPPAGFESTNPERQRQQTHTSHPVTTTVTIINKKFSVEWGTQLTNFDVLLTLHLSKILVYNQLNAQILVL